jgi:hypothetical protein
MLHFKAVPHQEGCMDFQVAAIITGLLGIASGALVTYLGAILKFRKELEAAYDKDLRDKRIESYKELWEHLQLLARYDRPKPLNLQTLEELSVAMRQWYFEVGGLYLSEETRSNYFDLKQSLKDLLDGPKYREGEALTEHDSKVLIGEASLLRARLTRDVGTRKSSPVADS